ncbi:MAG TPA: DUF1232 domain-containing protein [Cyclobacteriaceae bacterium]|nr:DUF1232 domain-containing protein [Cyclobacteriaceae bacterium]
MQANILDSKIFRLSLDSATLVLGNKYRTAAILTRTASRMIRLRTFWINKEGIKEKSYALLRMTKAYTSGKYKRVPLKTLVLVVAVFAYLINPLDVVPDVIPAAGFADDFSLLLWLINSMGSEIDEFMLWEQS